MLKLGIKKITIITFLVLVGIATLINNVFYPVYGICCFIPVESQKFVIGLPTAVIPRDFGDGVWYGVTFHIKGILALLFLYFPAAFLGSKYIYNKAYNKSLKSDAASGAA